MLMACIRGLDAAISSTWASPAAVSMITSSPSRFSRPFCASIAETIASTAYTSLALPAFGIMMRSSRPSVCSMRSTTSRTQ
jgi:hypothetical protein